MPVGELVEHPPRVLDSRCNRFISEKHHDGERTSGISLGLAASVVLVARGHTNYDLTGADRPGRRANASR